MEQTRDSVLRYGEVVGCELLNFFVLPKKKSPMSTVDQWKKTLQWTAGITACLFMIYASAFAVQLLVRAPDWAEALSELPTEMLSNFLQMLVLGPFLLSIPLFVISLVVVRAVRAFTGRWNPRRADACANT